MNSIKILLTIALAVSTLNAIHVKKRDFIDNLKIKLKGDLKTAFDNLKESDIENYRAAFAQLNPQDAENIVEGYLKENLDKILTDEARRDIRHPDASGNWEKRKLIFNDGNVYAANYNENKGNPLLLTHIRDIRHPDAAGNWDKRKWTDNIKLPILENKDTSGEEFDFEKKGTPLKQQSYANNIQVDNWVDDVEEERREVKTTGDPIEAEFLKWKETKRENANLNSQNQGLSVFWPKIRDIRHPDAAGNWDKRELTDGIEDEFLKWKEVKREASKENKIVALNSMIQPLSPDQSDERKNDPIIYFDAALAPTFFDEKKDKKQTLVPNPILKQLILDYKRLRDLEAAYKAGDLGVKMRNS